VKIAFISDVHGNMPALETCLKAISENGCSQIFCLGDTFGYFDDGAKCYETLSSLGAEFILGNHEAMLLGSFTVEKKLEEVYRLNRERTSLSSEMRINLTKLLPYKTVTLPTGKKLLLVHGSPWDPLQGYVYPDSDLSLFSNLPYDYIFMGHTHHPFINSEPNICIVNTGSCGLPRDIGNLACFAVYDCTLDSVKLIRPALDLKAIKAKYPQAHPTVLNCLKR
jgi:predicted phosphodiesterase